MSGINPYGSYIVQTLLGGGNTPQPQSSVQQVDIIQTPAQLKNLATSLILRGEVTQTNRDGTTVIETNRGNVTVKLDNPLPQGSKLDIQIPPQNQAQKQNTAIVQPTLVKAVQEAQQAKTDTVIQSTQNQLAQTIKDVQSLQNTAQQATTNLNNGQVNPSQLTIGQAVRITPLPAPLNTPQALTINFQPPAQIPTSTQATLNTQITQSPLTLVPSSQSSAPVLTPPPQIPSTPQTALFVANNVVIKSPVTGQNIAPITIPNTPQSVAPLPSQPVITPTQNIVTTNSVPTPQTADARVQAIQNQAVTITPPSQPTSPSSTLNAQAGQITATVTGFTTEDGNPIIQTLNPQGQAQYSTLHYPAKNLTAGTVITLTPLPNTTISLQPQTPSWQSVTQLFDTMAPLLGQSAMQSLMTLVPQATTPKQFPAAALLFLAAAKGGDLSGWLGTRPLRSFDQAPQTIKSSIENLMKDMMSQTLKTATPSDPPMVQNAPEWRGYNLPIQFGADIHNAAFWVKDDEGGQNNEAETKDKAMRFVVDLTLSRMGDVYFDGYVDQAKKIFDLAVMTERSLSNPMQTVIKSIWHKTMAGIDMEGQLLFKDIK